MFFSLVYVVFILGSFTPAYTLVSVTNLELIPLFCFMHLASLLGTFLVLITSDQEKKYYMLNSIILFNQAAYATGYLIDDLELTPFSRYVFGWLIQFLVGVISFLGYGVYVLIEKECKGEEENEDVIV